MIDLMERRDPRGRLLCTQRSPCRSRRRRRECTGELARYLTAILGVDGAFIAPRRSASREALRTAHAGVPPEKTGQSPGKLQLSEMAGTPCGDRRRPRIPVGIPRSCDSSFPLDADFQKMGLRVTPGTRWPMPPAGGQLGLIAAVARKPFPRARRWSRRRLRIFAVRVNSRARASHAGPPRPCVTARSSTEPCSTGPIDGCSCGTKTCASWT